jgi:membrane-bound ClpP family serine protease
MSPILWITLLVVVGLALIMLEVFVPSGGVLGLLSVLALGAGVVTAFLEHGVATGMTVLTGTFLAVPAVLVAAFRWFPSTPLGRRVLPPPPAADDVLPDLADRRRLRELVGRPGRTLGELLPWGRVEVDGQTFEAVSDGRPLAAVQGRSLVVRQASEAPSEPDAEALLPAAVEPGAAATPRLSNLLEEFDFDEIRQNSAPADELDSPPSANQA